MGGRDSQRPVDIKGGGSGAPDRAPQATVDSARRLRITSIVCAAILVIGLLLVVLAL